MKKLTRHTVWQEQLPSVPLCASVWERPSPIHARMTVVLMIFLLTSMVIPALLIADPYPGYTLFTPNNSRTTYLIDEDNNTVHTWAHNVSGGYSMYLKDSGNLLRTGQVNNNIFGGGGGQGMVQELDWDGDLVWQFTYSSNSYMSHHDIEPMPNGNVLMIAWEYKSITETRQAGYSRNVALWPDHVIEVEPDGDDDGTIVWEWHAWDHLVQDYDQSRDNYGTVADHPELLDINMSGAGGAMGGDWMHVNGISYNPDLDQIVISSHNLDEIYVIDHSTTTEEAASHSGGNSGMGGDILYRWGRPTNYDANGTQVFNVVHCSVWIPSGLPGAGHIMAFNNREGTHASHVVEIIPPMDDEGNYTRTAGQPFGPSDPTWTYASNGFYSQHLGGCQRLPNGNTLIVESTSGYIFEVDEAGTTQWSYDYHTEIVRALRYGFNHPGVYSLNPIDDGEIVMNEILVINEETVTDQDGEADPWVELYNNGDEEYSLSYFALSTSTNDPDMWTFPDTTIGAGEYLIVWLDGDEEQEGLHTNFEMPTMSGLLYLFAPDESMLDNLTYVSPSADVSTGRYPNGTGDFCLMTPTFAAENYWDNSEVTMETKALPAENALRDCYPNPFNSTVSIQYELASPDLVKISVYNVMGQQVAILVHDHLSAGSHQITWQGLDNGGNHVASGIYLVMFQCNQTYSTQKITLVK